MAKWQLNHPMPHQKLASRLRDYGSQQRISAIPFHFTADDTQTLAEIPLLFSGLTPGAYKKTLKFLPLAQLLTF